jgi:Methyltransferase small domain
MHTQVLNNPCSVSLQAPRKISQIRETLSQAGYTEPRILELLDITELPMSRRRWQTLPPYVQRARDDSPLEILVRLFLLRQAVSLGEVRCGIKPTQVEDWVETGLLQVNGSSVTATAELCPYGSLVVVADWSDDSQPDLHQVMGIAASSRTLAQATIRRHARATLDLGTGCGVLALLAAAHSEQVVAVDSNPRALRMAMLNAQLNGLTEIEFLEGNLLDPVRGRQFDLIVCNPPFVIAPEQIYLHSHSGMPLDHLCETIVRTAPAFMREGGYCQLLCNWVQLAGEDWRGRLASWFDENGCDAWILHSHSENAAEYALNRLSNLAPSAAHLKKQFDAWISYYERERIEAIGFGLITMRRSKRSLPWFRCDSWPEMIGACGDAIERGFAARDFLEAHSDDRVLLEARVRRAPNIEWRQAHDVADLDSAVHSSLRFTNGLAYVANIDSAIVKFVSRCVGDRPLSEHLQQAAAISGEDPTQFAPRFLKVVRRLIELGFLLPI